LLHICGDDVRAYHTIRFSIAPLMMKMPKLETLELPSWYTGHSELYEAAHRHPSLQAIIVTNRTLSYFKGLYDFPKKYLKSFVLQGAPLEHLFGEDSSSLNLSSHWVRLLSLGLRMESIGVRSYQHITNLKRIPLLPSSIGLKRLTLRDVRFRKHRTQAAVAALSNWLDAVCKVHPGVCDVELFGFMLGAYYKVDICPVSSFAAGLGPFDSDITHLVLERTQESSSTSRGTSHDILTNGYLLPNWKVTVLGIKFYEGARPAISLQALGPYFPCVTSLRIYCKNVSSQVDFNVSSSFL
jgi:hypothetical protein